MNDVCVCMYVCMYVRMHVYLTVLLRDDLAALSSAVSRLRWLVSGVSRSCSRHVDAKCTVKPSNAADHAMDARTAQASIPDGRVIQFNVPYDAGPGTTVNVRLPPPLLFISNVKVSRPRRNPQGLRLVHVGRHAALGLEAATPRPPIAIPRQSVRAVVVAPL